MTNPRKFLFICTGNTCRSVMAEFLLNKLSRDKGLGWEARSCGVAAERHFQVPQGVRSALKAEGIESVEHTAQLVTRDLLSWADAALTMTPEHRAEVLDKFPEFRAKVHVLKPYAGLKGPEDVADPIGQPDKVYAACCGEIRKALDAVIGRAAPAGAKEA